MTLSHRILQIKRRYPICMCVNNYIIIAEQKVASEWASEGRINVNASTFKQFYDFFIMPLRARQHCSCGEKSKYDRRCLLNSIPTFFFFFLRCAEMHIVAIIMMMHFKWGRGFFLLSFSFIFTNTHTSRISRFSRISYWQKQSAEAFESRFFCLLCLRCSANFSITSAARKFLGNFFCLLSSHSRM